MNDEIYSLDGFIGCPDKGTSVNSLATSAATAAAMFANADDHFSNCV